MRTVSIWMPFSFFFSFVCSDSTDFPLFYQPRHHKDMTLHLFASPIKQKWKSDRTQWDFPVFADWCFGVSSVAFSTFSPGPCLVPFVSVSGKCVGLSKTIGFAGLRRTLQSTTDSKLYFSTELLGHYYGAWSEQCLLVFTGRQLESSLIGTIGTSMGQRGYNGVIEHLWGNQSMGLLTKMSFIIPELCGWSVLEWSMWEGCLWHVICTNVQMCHISYLEVIVYRVYAAAPQISKQSWMAPPWGPVGCNNGWIYNSQTRKRETVNRCC